MSRQAHPGVIVLWSLEETLAKIMYSCQKEEEEEKAKEEEEGRRQ